ncbi:hypothetical protein AB0H43_25225 [Hamadaea sp. NPDC050747]|uniref:hypothetical protein n=1 Tax=Hamadaea sp. NPDC050747 TaxID=3155789 RepID=UPI0033E3F5BD
MSSTTSGPVTSSRTAPCCNAVLPAESLAAPASALRPDGLLITITAPVPGPETLGRADVRTH